MLPLVLKREEVEVLLADAADPGNELTVDLPNQKVVRSSGEAFSFDIDPFRKVRSGLDASCMYGALTNPLKRFLAPRRSPDVPP